MLAGGLAIAGCNERASKAAGEVHASRRFPDVVGRRVVFCDDGARADIHFLGNGLRMAVTWLPAGKTELLQAPATGGEFRGTELRALIIGDALAFKRRSGPVRVCHRSDEER